MQTEAGVLARQEGLGAVVCCPRGCVHIQFGATTLTLTQEQYVGFVAMLADSAANYEMHRHSHRRSGIEAIDEHETNRTDSDY